MSDVAVLVFCFCAFIIFYSFGGYGIFLWMILKIRQLFNKKEKFSYSGSDSPDPDVCLFVTAYNERAHVRQKIENSLALDYPNEKLRLIWVTDGSTDDTPDIAATYPQVEVFHEPERKGKADALNRGIAFVKAPIVVFTDCNTLLSKGTVRAIVREFRHPKVGCVAGEKRIANDNSSTPVAAGEGLYWRIESWLKKLDSRFYSTIGAAGEIFALRTELYSELEKDTLLDDFILSMRTAMKGYRIAYAQDAQATEFASSNAREEMKRKVRIAAGAYQSIARLPELLNPFRYGRLSFQYFSHKVLRWTLAPVSLPLLFFSGLYLSIQPSVAGLSVYQAATILQVIFYLFALFGYLLQRNNIRSGWFFAPYYFTLMNFAYFPGFIRYLLGKQTVLWEKAQRSGSFHEGFS
jgi:cellulose synthase/poly-beta-1,6-N-acetylglucosamine synthase-like glycosyltransferase